MERMGILQIKISMLFLFVALLAGCAHKKEVLIESDPTDASVFLNGMERGITPLREELVFRNKSETFVVVARKGDCYEPGKTIIKYEPEEETKYSIKLKPICKDVVIDSMPSGATLYLDGVQAGITPLRRNLRFEKSQEYIAVAKMDGYEDNQAVIALEPLDFSHYDIPLKRKETAYIDLVLVEPRLTDKGVKLTITKRPTLAYLEIIERSPNVKSVTRVTANEDRTVQIGSPMISPTGDILVYSEYIEEEGGDSYSNIWRQTVGLLAKTRITYGKWRDFFPCFTPGGENLLFSSNRTSSNPTLWRIRMEGGGGITKITNTVAEDYYPSISYDNQLIAYASNPPAAEEAQIWTVNTDGSLPTQLREGESPHISPSGNKIVFVRRDKTTSMRQVWVMNADGTEETQLTQNVDYEAIDPRWSPDGEWIVYSSNEGFDSKKRRNFDVWVMKADGSGAIQLTTNGSWDDRPCWDGIGQYIYFRSNRGEAWNIWRFRPIIPRKVPEME